MRKKEDKTISNLLFEVNSILKYTYRNNNSILSIEIGRDIISIGDEAFMNCENLKKLKLSNDVKRIGANAFRNCLSLSNVDLGEVYEIGRGAFFNCPGLSKILIPLSCKVIAEYDCFSKNTEVFYMADKEIYKKVSHLFNDEYKYPNRGYYYSEIKPDESGKYWHYVDGKITIWD